MKTAFLKAMALALGTLWLPGPVSAAPILHGPLAVPPASFLNYHVGTVPELSREVALDPEVRLRLCHHFHRSGPAMLAYIHDNLVLKDLTVARRYKVYCVAPSGREYFVIVRLAVGTPVFVRRADGRPILKLACGNPLVATLPREEPRLVHPLARAATAPAETPLLTDPGLSSLEMAMPETELADAPAVFVADSLEAGSVTVAALPAGATLLVTGGGAGGLGLGWLAGVPVVGGLFAISSGGHGTVPAFSTVTASGRPQGASPVPEPSTPLVFGLGGGAVLALGLRRKKQSAAHQSPSDRG